MLINTITSRWVAFAIHLLISVLILLSLLGVIFFVWYPNDLIHVGGIDGLKILFGVDIILGPLLTLVVFSANKKGLAMDLALIGFLQIACLCGGLWLIYQQRPLLQVIADDGVHIVSASDAKKYELNLANIPGSYPKTVMLLLPADTETWGTIRFASEFADEKPFATRQDLYLPLASVSDDDFNNRINIIQSKSTAYKAKASSNCIWISLKSPHALGYACVSKRIGVEQLSNTFFSREN